MATPSFELREFFHLALLRHLGARLSGRSYAVKGGMCLRFFHRSPRLSQDMDLDIIAQVQSKTLEKAVDSLLEAKAFLACLASQGIIKIVTTKPKQTEIVQRWKVALHVSNETSLPTKIEFSRRHEKITYATGIPDAELLIHHKILPFTAQFYKAEDLVAQKILALASESRFATRDLFDLHHLLRLSGVKPQELIQRVKGKDLERAIEKINRFNYRDFKEQVAPYLPATLMDLYKDPKAFEKLKTEVEQVLLEIL